MDGVGLGVVALVPSAHGVVDVERGPFSELESVAKRVGAVREQGRDGVAEDGAAGFHEGRFVGGDLALLVALAGVFGGVAETDGFAAFGLGGVAFVDVEDGLRGPDGEVEGEVVEFGGVGHAVHVREVDLRLFQLVLAEPGK